MAQRRNLGRHGRAMVRILSSAVPVVDERMTPHATTVVVTKDRRDEALRAVASTVDQSACVEVLVRVLRRLGYAVRIEDIENALPAPAGA
jgi:hypothetical protein